MPEYYGGAPNAFAGGMEFGAAQRKRRKEENALAALIEQYGPTAADPQSAALMQRVQQSGDLHPYDVTEAQRVDAARVAEVASGGARMGDPAVHARDVATEDRDRAAQLDAGRRAVALLKYAKANGKDIGAAFDVAQQGLTAIGISPDKFAEVRNEVVTNPDSIDELEQLMLGLQDPNKRGAMSAPISVFNKNTKQWEVMQPMADGSNPIIPGYEMAQTVLGAERNATGRGNLEQRTRGLTIQEFENMGGKAPPGMTRVDNEDGSFHFVPTRGSLQEQEYEKNTQEADVLDMKFVRSLGALTDHSSVIFDSSAKARKYFENAPAGVLMQNLRRLAPVIAGMPSSEAWQALRDITNNIKIDEIQRMRQNSPTGAAVGTASDRDMDILGGALGQIDHVRDPKELVAVLDRITTSYDRLVTAARRDATAAEQRMQKRPRRQDVPARSAAPGGQGSAVPGVEEMSDEDLMKILSGGN